jgi:uncharacterized membrane protein YeaQ/YmgE (transglycosylase-associated protein family)
MRLAKVVFTPLGVPNGTGRPIARKAGVVFRPVAIKSRTSTQGESRMHLIWMCIVGLIVGAIAKLMMPGRDPGGFIVTILLGIAGSIVGGFLGRAIGLYRQGEGAGILMSIIGAIILLALYRMFVRRTV